MSHANSTYVDINGPHVNAGRVGTAVERGMFSGISFDRDAPSRTHINSGRVDIAAKEDSAKGIP